MNENVRDRMAKVGISQADMILKLRERGLVVQPPEMSQILRGINTYPKAIKVLTLADKILKELEHEYCHCGYNFEFGRVEGTEKDERTGKILNGEFKPMRW